MATGGEDVQSMFQKMGEKLGWFKQDTHAPVKQASSTGKKLSLKARKKTSCSNTTPATGSTKSDDVSRDHNDAASKKGVTRKVKTKPKKTLEGFLSSDTDSDKENFQIAPSTKPLQKQGKSLTKTMKDSSSKKAVIDKVALKLCSDSDDENDFQIRPRQCAKELVINSSFIDESPEFKVPSRKSTVSHRSSNHQSSRNSYDYSIIKNRQSLASMTLNLDELGDPLVESTRIHRRSSASFQQLFDKINEHELDKSNDQRKISDTSNDQTMAMKQSSPEQRNGEHDLCSTLENLNIDRAKYCDDENAANDTRYTTAVESIETNTSSSSDGTDSIITDLKNVKKLVKDALKKTIDKSLMDNKTKKKGKKIKKKAMVIILSESEEESASHKESGELVEVMDAGTQTVDSNKDDIANEPSYILDLQTSSSKSYSPSSRLEDEKINEIEHNFESDWLRGNTEIKHLYTKSNVYHNKTVDGDNNEGFLKKGDEIMYQQETVVESLIEAHLHAGNKSTTSCGTSPVRDTREVLQTEELIHEMDTIAVDSQHVNAVYSDETESYDLAIGTGYKHETITGPGSGLSENVGESNDSFDDGDSGSSEVDHGGAHEQSTHDSCENVEDTSGNAQDASVCSSPQTESYGCEEDKDESYPVEKIEINQDDDQGSDMMDESGGIELYEVEVADMATQTPSAGVGVSRRNNGRIKPAVLSLSSDSDQENGANTDNHCEKSHSDDSVGSEKNVDEFEISEHCTGNNKNRKKVKRQKISISSRSSSSSKSENSDNQSNYCHDHDDKHPDSTSRASGGSASDDHNNGSRLSRSVESSPEQHASRKYSTDGRNSGSSGMGDSGASPRQHRGGVDNGRSSSSDPDVENCVDPAEVSFAALASTQRGNSVKSDTKSCASVDTSQQSWRSGRTAVSDSSEDEDQLESFFQKLRKPEPVKSDSSDSPDNSMKDFIVEDDEMSSESDDDAFYLRENQRLENTPLSQRLKTCPVKDGDDDDDDDDDGVFSSKVYPDSVTKQKHKNKRKQNRRGSCPFSSDSECDTLPDLDRNTPASPGDGSIGWEKGTSLTRTPKQQTLRTNISANDKSHKPVLPKGSEDGLFKTPNPIRKKGGSVTSSIKTKIATQSTDTSRKTPTSSKRDNMLTGYISLSDSDSEDDGDCGIVECVTPALGVIAMSTSDSSIGSSGTNTPTTPGVMRTPSSGSVSSLGMPLSASRAFTCSFLKSLSNTTTDEGRDRQARRYVHGFKKLKEELSAHLYKLYNTTVFESKLPADMSLIWNKRLLRTAGYCAYKKNRANPEDRTARIELSTKVCDSAERVRDTLIHEMCHAAVWILNGVNGGHGPYWKFWARQASRIHPELPTISRCHSYSINTKFTYRCTQCGYSIGRHSKSLDTSKFACGYCKGSFELMVNPTPTTPGSAVGPKATTPRTPRTPNRFALFVKDNYNTVKSQNKDLKHGEVMKELSKLFAASKINS